MNTEHQPLDGIILTPDAPDGLVSLTTAKPLDLFTTPTVITALLAAVRTEATRDFTPDLSTDKGRKAIASRAFKVARTKTFLDGIGKDEVTRLKELPRQVDAGRKALRDGLDQLADEIRLPLTKWEADQAELERLRKAEEDRKQQEREEALRKEGEERERKAAEAAAAAAPAPAQAPAPQTATDQQAHPPAPAQGEGPDGTSEPPAWAKAAFPQDFPNQPAPAPAWSSAPSSMNPDIEHRRACNREALADMVAVMAAGYSHAEIATNILRAIVTGKVRHISITY